MRTGLGKSKSMAGWGLYKVANVLEVRGQARTCSALETKMGVKLTSDAQTTLMGHLVGERPWLQPLSLDRTSVRSFA